jgi:acyl carrier protein
MLAETIIDVLSEVLRVPRPEAGEPGFGPRTCARWDSLRHVQIALALEERFACTFEPAEVPRLVDVPAITRVLQGKGLS